VHRYGKCFFIDLNGPGRMPVLHFGMTGMLQVCCLIFRRSCLCPSHPFTQVRGELPMHYREAPRQASNAWPPKFMKVSSTLTTSRRPSRRAVSSFCISQVTRVRPQNLPSSMPVDLAESVFVPNHSQNLQCQSWASIPSCRCHLPNNSPHLYPKPLAPSRLSCLINLFLQASEIG